MFYLGVVAGMWVVGSAALFIINSMRGAQMSREDEAPYWFPADEELEVPEGWLS